jgi:cysteine dioxygenase
MLSYQQPLNLVEPHLPQVDMFSSPRQSMDASVDRSDGFQCLVQKLSDVLGPSSGIDSDDVDENELIRLMEQYTSQEHHWRQYALADLSRNYTRNLVDNGNGKSNVLVVVWNPGRGSPIHDHANAHCVMKILKGSLTETLYQSSHASSETTDSWATHTPPQVMKESTYVKDQVTYVSDKIGLHKIWNPSSDEPAVSLHLYTPPHAANFGFNLFDEKTGKATRVKQAGFFSDRGKPIAEAKYGSF